MSLRDGDGEDEVDAQFRTMSPHPSLRHFKRGISLVTQWTGTEYKNMEKVFASILADAANPEVVRAVRAILTFIYYAHFERHSDHTLTKLHEACYDFHDSKKVFVDLGVRKHFNIPKLHSMQHYLNAIRSFGTADGYSTEGTERLHIDYAKLGYRASNCKMYIAQMACWLARQEAVSQFAAYLQ